MPQKTNTRSRSALSVRARRAPGAALRAFACLLLPMTAGSLVALPISAFTQNCIYNHIYLFNAPNPPLDVTSTYANGQVTNASGNRIPVTLDYEQGHVYDQASNIIGFVDLLQGPELIERARR